MSYEFRLNCAERMHFVWMKKKPFKQLVHDTSDQFHYNNRIKQMTTKSMTLVRSR